MPNRHSGTQNWSALVCLEEIISAYDDRGEDRPPISPPASQTSPEVQIPRLPEKSRGPWDVHRNRRSWGGLKSNVGSTSPTSRRPTRSVESEPEVARARSEPGPRLARFVLSSTFRARLQSPCQSASWHRPCFLAPFVPLARSVPVRRLARSLRVARNMLPSRKLTISTFRARKKRARNVLTYLSRHSGHIVPFYGTLSRKRAIS